MAGAATQWPSVPAMRGDSGSSSWEGGSKWDPYHKSKRGSGEATWQPAEQYLEQTPDFRVLAEKYPSLREYVRYRGPEGSGWASIDWTDYNATRELTRVLLHHDHGVNWSLPPEHLCPAVTNRANYIRWISDLTAMTRRMMDGDRYGDGNTIEEDDGGGSGYAGVRGLDIGTGANCIYPLLAASIHGWHFVGTDTSERALEAARANVAANPHLKALIEVRRANAGVPACRATMRSSRKGGEEDQDQDEREGERGGPCPGSMVCSSGRGGLSFGDGDGNGIAILTATLDPRSEEEKGERVRENALDKLSRKGEEDVGKSTTLSSAPVSMELSELKAREGEEKGGQERGEEEKETEGEGIDQIGREGEPHGCDSATATNVGVGCRRRYDGNGGDGGYGGDGNNDGDGGNGVDRCGVHRGSAATTTNVGAGCERRYGGNGGDGCDGVDGAGGHRSSAGIGRRMAMGEEWRQLGEEAMNCDPFPPNEDGRDKYPSQESQHSLIAHHDDGTDDDQEVQRKKKMKYHTSETMAAASRGEDGGGGGSEEGKKGGNKNFARSGHGDDGQVIRSIDGYGDGGEERYGAEVGDKGREEHGNGGQNPQRGGDDEGGGRNPEERMECGRCKVGVCGMKLGHIFLGVIGEDERFDFCMCNPPFFESIELAKANPKTACGGTFEEMVCEGGEHAFIKGMIGESLILRRQIQWYTAMVGRKTDLKSLIALLRNLKVPELRTTVFRQGRTMRWGFAWSFLEWRRANRVHQPLWIRERLVRRQQQQQQQQQPFLLSSSEKKGVTRNRNLLQQQQQQQQRRAPKISFALEGLGQKVTAFTVLQLLNTELSNRGAVCKMDAHSFQVTGSIPGPSSSNDKPAAIGPQLPQGGNSLDRSQVVGSILGSSRSNDKQGEIGPQLPQQGSSFHKSEVVAATPTVAAPAAAATTAIGAAALSSAVSPQQNEKELKEFSGGSSCRAGFSFFVKIMEQSKGAVHISACLAKGLVCTDDIELGFHYLFGEMEDTLRMQILSQRK